MASKRKYADITKFTDFKWEEEKGEVSRSLVGECDFCPAKIYDDETYFNVMNTTRNYQGDYIAMACNDCAVKSGAKW